MSNNKKGYKFSFYILQENILLTIQLSDQNLLIIIMTNLDTNLQNKKLLVTNNHYYK